MLAGLELEVGTGNALELQLPHLGCQRLGYVRCHDLCAVSFWNLPGGSTIQRACKEPVI